MVEGAHDSVGTGYLGGHLGAGGGGATGGGAGGPLDTGYHTAIIGRFALLGVQHRYDLAVHAQQEGDQIALLEGALAGELISGLGSADVVAHPGHGGGGGGALAGGDAGERSGCPVVVDPDGFHVGVVVVYVILLDLGVAGESAVVVYGGGGEGEGERAAVVGHIGALGVCGDQGGVVHLVIFDGVAQCGAVDRRRCSGR